jgi:hypothetical protein
LSTEGSGHEWTFVCSGHRSELEQAASEFGGVIVDDAPLSLEEIFVSRVLK